MVWELGFWIFVHKIKTNFSAFQASPYRYALECFEDQVTVYPNPLNLKSMEPQEAYLDINRRSWNSRVDAHYASDFYKVKEFVEGACSLQSIELEQLGDVRGLRILHVQCHFGQDSIALSRRGAEVTGVDFSEKAIAKARELAELCGTKTRFVCCDVYDLPRHLDETFDVVFTSYGVLGWLPDLNRWASTLSRFLKPGGRLLLVEFHPVVWMFDDDFSKVQYRYMNSGPILETQSGTYAEPGADLTLQSMMWNHGLGDVTNSLIENGLQIRSLREYDYSPYPCFRNTVEFEPGKFRIPHLGDQIPMVYSILATAGL
jgi:SAM-dependent methyltransferase